MFPKRAIRHIRRGRIRSGLRQPSFVFRRPNKFFTYSWREVWNDFSSDNESSFKYVIYWERGFELATGTLGGVRRQ